MVAIAAAIDPALARRRYLIGVTVITLSTIAWGAGPLFIRLLPFDMWTIVFWRGVFGAAFAGVYLIWRFGRDTGTVIRGMGMQGLWITLYCTATITVFVPAVQYTSVANAMVIYAALPFFTATIAWIWLRERPTRATLVASAVVMLGILIMVNPTTGGPRLGDLLAVIGTAAAAMMTVAIRRSRKTEMVPIAFLALILSTTIAWPLADGLVELTARDYAVFAAYGLGPMTLGMMLFVIGSAMIPATLSALIGTMETPISALWAWIGVGEAPPPATFLGGSIVLGGVIARLLAERKSQEGARESVSA